MFKHVAKQRRLAASNKQVQLSDEDSSGNSASEDEASLSGSGDEGSGSDGSGMDEDQEEGLDEEEAPEEEEDEEEELLPPPPGFPTALAALDNPIASPSDDAEAASAEDSILICVVCPSKVLKHGKMLEVHLASKVRFNALLLAHALRAELSRSSAGSHSSSLAVQSAHYRPILSPCLP
jgi:hypothetical protein